MNERRADVALIGLVRVSTDKQKTRRQHDALDPVCLKVFEEKVSGKLAAGDRPALLAALSHVRDGDLLTVQEVDRLGRNLLEGLIVLPPPRPPTACPPRRSGRGEATGAREGGVVGRS
jgi:Resolvase, N terminal domain